MIIRTGDLRTQVTLQKKIRSPNGRGGAAVTWQDGPLIWANVEVLRATEAMLAGVERSSTLYRVIMRFRSDISVEDRLRWSAGTVDIKSCGDPDGRREGLIITAETIATSG